MMTDPKTGLVYRPHTMDLSIIREQRDYRWLKPRPDDVVLDIGANIGASAVCVFNTVRQVVCIEPEPENYALLQVNTMGQENVYLIRGAVAATAGPRELYVSKTTDQSNHRLVPTRGRTSITVECYSLEELLWKYKPTLIKMDIEGGEYELLPVLANLPGHVRGLALELHFNQGNNRETAQAWVDKLEGGDWFPVRETRGILGKHWNTVGVWLR